MTNEQLTQEVMNIKEHQAKSDAERDNIITMMDEFRDDIKSTKTLAEDVHIMALNMQNMQKAQENMQKAQEDINKKVDALSSKEFVEYEESKKLVKQNVISKITSAIVAFVLGGLTFLFGLYTNK